ncbi:hypothetical protein KR067_003374, partial [Drosophila pandora]
INISYIYIGPIIQKQKHIQVFGSSKFEIRLEKFEAIKGDEETLIEFNLKIVGRERSLNGTFKTLIVFDESLMAHGRLHTFKNGDWVQSNLKVDMNGCDFFQFFIKRFYKDFVKHFPDPICPLPVGEYLINKTIFSAENWPNYMSPGLTKTDLFFEKDEKIIGGLSAVMDLIVKN